MKMLLSIAAAAAMLVPATVLAQGKGQFGPVQAPKMAQAPMQAPQMAQAPMQAPGKSPMQAPGKAPFQAPTQAPKGGQYGMGGPGGGMQGYQSYSYQPGYAQPMGGYRSFSYEPGFDAAGGYRSFSAQPMTGARPSGGWRQANVLVGGNPRTYTSSVNKALGNVE